MNDAARDARAERERPLLAHPPFILFLVARWLAMLGRQTVAVAVGWQMYALTGSALDLGFIGLAQFVPSILLVLVAGHQLGEFESGLTAAWLGVVPSVVAGGIGTLAIVVLWIRFFPGLAATDRLDARPIDVEHPAKTKTAR